MLEQKVQELLGVSAEILADQEAAGILKKEFNADLEALPGASDLVSTYEQKAKTLDAKSIADNTKGSKLKEEILGLMTEKTHRLECATVSKRINRRLVVTDAVAFYNFLGHFAKGVLKKVKYSFPGGDIIKLVDTEIICLKHLKPMAEIAETESLVVKPN